MTYFSFVASLGSIIPGIVQQITLDPRTRPGAWINWRYARGILGSSPSSISFLYRALMIQGCLSILFSLFYLKFERTSERLEFLSVKSYIYGMRNNAYKCRIKSLVLPCIAIILNYDSIIRSRRSRGSKASYLFLESHERGRFIFRGSR